MDISSGLPVEAIKAFEGVLGHEMEARFVPQVLEAGVHLGNRRAALLGRAMYPIDVEFALSVMCWWPFKPPVSDMYLEAAQRFRREVIRNSATLDHHVPDEALRMDWEELYEKQRTGDWRKVFQLGEAD
ncbi:hypothetical protein [Streptomyces sp. bgisy159]|uniref:hypothetical protein n=1 Tax=Streptomyces sp. bgisy159 TaxID=3413795 RepID=UPI003F49BA24